MRHIFYILIIGKLLIFSIFLGARNYIKDTYSSTRLVVPFIEENQVQNSNEKIELNYFVDKCELKDYSGTEFKITEEGKNIINNIRSLHKSKSLIGKNYADKELCAGYIWILSEKIWGENSPYYLGMMNTETRKPSKAWELAKFYSGLGGDVLSDLGAKFSVNKKDFWEKITKDDLQTFFSLAFDEKALFGDIGFLYKDTKYTSFLNGRSSNSHITKNIGVSKFEFSVGKEYDNSVTHLSVLSDIIGCSKDIKKDLFTILKNYNLELNGKRVYLEGEYLYYLNNDNSIGKKVDIKFLDKITYDDITLTHYYESRSNVNGLFDMVCKGDFFPVNIISINSRLIEKI